MKWNTSKNSLPNFLDDGITIFFILYREQESVQAFYDFGFDN